MSWTDPCSKCDKPRYDCTCKTLPIKKKLNEIAIVDTSWIDKFKYHTENERWLKVSAHIAIKLLKYLCENNLTKYDMIEQLDISTEICDKILHEDYNFDLDLITKIEEKFNIKLIEIV